MTKFPPPVQSDSAGPAKPAIFSLYKAVAYNSPTFANLTKVSSTEKFSLKPKNIKYG
jgi:hypothetical protein